MTHCYGKNYQHDSDEKKSIKIIFDYYNIRKKDLKKYGHMTNLTFDTILYDLKHTESDNDGDDYYDIYSYTRY